MLDTYIAQYVLAERKITSFLTDSQLIVIDHGGDLSLYREEESLVGCHLTTITPAFIGYEDQLAALLSGDLATLRLELINRETAEGNLIYLTVTASPHKDHDQQIVGLLHFIEDVTVLGETRQRLTQQHNDLYLLHQQLSAANLRFAAANAELQALDELKSRFVSIAAHELRTPIASMLGYVDFMLHDEQESLSPLQHDSLTVVERSAQRLLTITNDLLDITKLEAGRLELILESINLRALIQAVITEFKLEIAEKQLNLTVSVAEGVPPVLCDEKRSIQILSNLISNAIKYTPQEGAITIRLQQQLLHSIQQTVGHELRMAQTRATMVETAGNTSVVVVTVSDTGIGIPTADLENMGKAFFRASNVYKARVNGTGLGLHITQSLCELQGGQLWVESTEGQGTTFFVTFPIDDGIFDITFSPVRQ